MQEMQEQMNSMNDSREFQEVESNHSGRLSHVSSQPAAIPSSRSMLSRDKRLPLDTWNTSGLQETFLVIKFLHLIHPEIILKEFTLYDTKRYSISSTSDWHRTSFAREEERIEGTIPMPTFARRPSTMSSLFPVDIRQNSLFGQQRQQISELQFDKFPTTSTFLSWKIRLKTKWLLVLIFFRRPWYGSKKWDGWFIGRIEVLMINCRKEFSKFWNVRREDCFCLE